MSNKLLFIFMFLCAIFPANLLAGSSLKKAALFGDVNAQFELGSKYFHGDILTPKNPKKAIKYLSKASEQGHEQATLILSNIYLNGYGVEKDAYASCRLIHAAAWKGLPNAQAVLAVYYCDGIGVEKDIVQCCAWYDVAAAQGIEEAKNALAETIREMNPRQITKATEISKELWMKVVGKSSHP